MLEAHAHRIAAFFEKSFESMEAMQGEMQNRDLLESARRVSFFLAADAKSCNAAERADARILTSAVLIARHQAEIVGQSEHSDELIAKAKAFVRAFGSAWKDASGRWKEYKAAFRGWQRPDQEALIASSIANYHAWSDVLRSIKDRDAEAYTEWLPYVRAHQAQIRRQIGRIGGQPALEGLRKQQSSGADNLTVVHEMMLEGKFEAEKLAVKTETFEESLGKSMETLAASPELIGDMSLALVSDARRQLVGMVPEGLSLHKRIDEVIDLDVFAEALCQRASISGKLIEVQTKYSAIVELMAELCAPARDDAMRELRTDVSRLSMDSFEDLTRRLFALLKTMRNDLVAFGLASIKPVLAKTAVEYEQQAFEERFGKKLDRTRRWLSESLESMPDAGVNDLWSSGMVRLVEDCREPLPETLHLDEKRVEELRRRVGDDCRLGALKLIDKSLASCKSLDDVADRAAVERVDRDPVYKVLRKRSMDSLQRDFYRSTVGEGGSSAMHAFTKYHWSIYSRIYAAIVGELRRAGPLEK